MLTIHLVVAMTDPKITADIDAEAGEVSTATTSTQTTAPQTQQSVIWLGSQTFCSRVVCTGVEWRVGEWWSAESSGGCGSRMVGAQDEWWVAEESGGCQRQVVGTEAEWWAAEANGGGHGGCCSRMVGTGGKWWAANASGECQR